MGKPGRGEAGGRAHVGAGDEMARPRLPDPGGGAALPASQIASRSAGDPPPAGAGVDSAGAVMACPPGAPVRTPPDGRSPAPAPRRRCGRPGRAGRRCRWCRIEQAVTVPGVSKGRRFWPALSRQLQPGRGNRRARRFNQRTRPSARVGPCLAGSVIRVFLLQVRWAHQPSRTSSSTCLVHLIMHSCQDSLTRSSGAGK
jgi:hypothetical protein